MGWLARMAATDAVGCAAKIWRTAARAERQGAIEPLQGTGRVVAVKGDLAIAGPGPGVVVIERPLNVGAGAGLVAHLAGRRSRGGERGGVIINAGGGSGDGGQRSGAALLGIEAPEVHDLPRQAPGQERVRAAVACIRGQRFAQELTGLPVLILVLAPQVGIGAQHEFVGLATVRRLARCQLDLRLAMLDAAAVGRQLRLLRPRLPRGGSAGAGGLTGRRRSPSARWRSPSAAIATFPSAPAMPSTWTLPIAALMRSS